MTKITDIVFVHGWGFNASIWDDIADDLAENIPTITPHFIDLGFINDIDKTPTNLPENAIGVGHSLGVLWLLKKYPKTLSALVSIAGFDHFCNHIPAREMRAMQENLNREPNKQMQGFWQACGTTNFCDLDQINIQKLNEGLDWLIEWDAREELKNLNCPILPLASKDDLIIPEKMTRDIWGKHAIQWSETGAHALPLTQAKWCAAQIKRFINEHK